MLENLSEDVRILREGRTAGLSHHGPPALATTMLRPGRRRRPPRSSHSPIREIEGFLGHAASAFDDVMSLAESLAPRNSLGERRSPACNRCSPISARWSGRPLDGERAFRRDLYRLAKLVLQQKSLNDFRIRESDFAAVHGALEKRDAALIARLHAETDRDERVSLVAAAVVLLFVELVRQEPIDCRLPKPPRKTRSMSVTRSPSTASLQSPSPAASPRSTWRRGAAEPELMEIAVLAVDGAHRPHPCCARQGRPGKRLTPLFARLLTHLN